MTASLRTALLLPLIAATLLLPAGQALPGTAQAGLEADAPAADPLWCPEGVTPIGGAGGCSPSFRTLTELFAWLHANDPAVPGVIWLERTFRSGLETADGFELDGRDFTNFDTQPLTIQGGWNGPGTSSVNHDDPSLFDGDGLYFPYWNAALTVNDVVFSGFWGSGLSITTVGDIRLSHVVSGATSDGPGHAYGASLWNTEGGDVFVSDSTFNGNDHFGLLVTTHGAVGLHNITANRNGRLEVNAGGASISSLTDDVPQDVTLTGVNEFNENFWFGLSIWTDGAIAIENVTAVGNYDDPGPGLRAGIGVYLDNTDAATPQPVSVSGANLFNDNTSTGLIVNSHGMIRAGNLSARGNGAWGVQLSNAGTGSGDLNVDGDNYIVDNASIGLGLMSNGTVEAANILAQGNGQDGIWVRTPVDALVNCAKVNSNGDYGIDASGVLGALTLNDVLFDGLNGSGDYFFTGKPVFAVGGCAAGADPATDPDAPGIDFIDLGGGGLISLNCGQLSGTGVILSDGLRLLLDCPTVGDVVIQVPKINDLPARLPKGFKFLAGLNADVAGGAYDKTGTPGLLTFSFPMPKNLNHHSLAILYWDGGKWIELSEAHFDDARMVYDGGYETLQASFDALVNFDGLFVLARR
jgi:hypothetical protein